MHGRINPTEDVKFGDSTCKICNEEGETIGHLLCFCPVLENKRLGKKTLEYLGVVLGLDIEKKIRFMVR